MKKLLTAFLSIVFMSVCFAGCDGTAPPLVSLEAVKPSIVATNFPAFDFARQICGDNANVTMLLPPGAESHSYEPSPQDIIKIQSCDLFIYVGGESDTWVDEIILSMDQPIRTLKMMDFVGVLEEEIVEGMQAEEEHDTEADEEIETDAHIWTSIRNAEQITVAIADAVCEIDKENSDTYRMNGMAYILKLTQLDEAFDEFFAALPNKTLVFGDRFPFRYFANDYDLDYYAAFPGCSTETEPSAATIAFLIDKVKSENISTVFYIEFSNPKLAATIAEATNTKTALLHSCHNVSKTELTNGVTYISLMEQNLEVLRGAL